MEWEKDRQPARSDLCHVERETDMMDAKTKPSEKTDAGLPRPEALWVPVGATLFACSVYMLLPLNLLLGAKWLLPVILMPLLALWIILYYRRLYGPTHIVGHFVTAVLTAFVASALAVLVYSIPRHTETAGIMLESAAILWATNIVVFSLWYWRLDAGGPHARAMRGSHEEGCFLFPQMLLPAGKRQPWSPRFLDYLFLAFNTSTAFSPTDTAILSRWAKVLIMLQSIISLGLVALVASRAINII